jgi:hypothetical protein
MMATLVRDKHAYAVVSDDGDLLARGCERVLRIGPGRTALKITLLADVLDVAGVDRDTVRCSS